MPHATGAASAGVLFKKDHLAVDAQAATAVLRRPACANPLAGAQHLLPGLAQGRGEVFIPRSATKAQGCELACQVGLHPLRHLLAKLLIGGAKSNIHDSSPKICLASSSR